MEYILWGYIFTGTWTLLSHFEKSNLNVNLQIFAKRFQISIDRIIENFYKLLKICLINLKSFDNILNQYLTLVVTSFQLKTSSVNENIDYSKWWLIRVKSTLCCVK